MRWIVLSLAGLVVAGCAPAPSHLICEGYSTPLGEREPQRPERAWTLTIQPHSWLRQKQTRSWGTVQADQGYRWEHVTEAHSKLLLGDGRMNVGDIDRVSGRLGVAIGNDHIRMTCRPATPMV